jgi:hypothetical protein
VVRQLRLVTVVALLEPGHAQCEVSATLTLAGMRDASLRNTHGLWSPSVVDDVGRPRCGTRRSAGRARPGRSRSVPRRAAACHPGRVPGTEASFHPDRTIDRSTRRRGPLAGRVSTQIERSIGPPAGADL